jgi:glycosyltransferase involved in cell wall biosynthesis
MVQEQCAVIRVGFVFSFDDGWLGGINYFRNLLTALYALPERKIEAVIFTGLRSSERNFDGFPAVKIVRSRLFDRGSILWRMRLYWQRMFSRDPLLERLLRKHDVALLSHTDWAGKAAAIPAIGWLPDFQHVHLPEFFSKREIALRNENFSNMCRYCPTIIVSSFDAQADLVRFDPGCKSKSEVLQFVAAATDEKTILPGRGELEKRYKFSGKYFLLPNQFWKHKNHRVVIEALGLLGREGKRVLVLATGSTADYRHPDYFQSLMERAKELGVLDDFRHLGIIPAPDLAGLMRDAAAIINPSSFEGWSTSVEEAKSLGKRVLLSDIPVHREQNPALGSYFPPDDADALASMLWAIWSNPASDEIQMIESARRATDERRLEFARKYQQIVLDTFKHRTR